MKNYVGRKIRGFRFRFEDEDEGGVGWGKHMEAYIGKVGLIIKQACKYVVVEFEDDEAWYYPISLIEPHLIDECTCDKIGDNTCNYCEELQNKAILEDAKDKVKPEIIDLSNVEGVEVMVSNDKKDWFKLKVIAKLLDVWIDNQANVWNYAKPIIPKYTHAELVEKLGEDFIYEK